MPGRAAASLRVIYSGPGHPVMNMAVDEAILLSAGPPTLRLYGWEPAGLSLGYFQRASDFDDVPGDHVVVRRLTGGGAIYHQDELTYSLILDGADDLPSGITAGYELVHAAILNALRSIGVHAENGPPEHTASPRPEHLWCFGQATHQDLVLPHYGKLLGSAQRRVRTPHVRMLQHGSLPLTRPDYPAAGCAAIADAKASPESVEKLPEELTKTISESLGKTPVAGALTKGELALATQLAQERYRDPAFLRRR